jgi:hypothetical protein
MSNAHRFQGPIVRMSTPAAFSTSPPIPARATAASEALGGAPYGSNDDECERRDEEQHRDTVPSALALV